LAITEELRGAVSEIIVCSLVLVP